MTMINGTNLHGSEPDDSAHGGPITVILACTSEHVDETEIKILRHEESADGIDLVVYRCPRCLGEHISARYQ